MLPASNANGNILTVRDEPTGPFVLGSPSSSSYPAAVGGSSDQTVANGLDGYTALGGNGVVGDGAGAAAAGVLARGARADVALHPAGDPAPNRIDAHHRQVT